MRGEIMALTIGTQLGSHEITALLGKGGMGEVYRARDSKLKREVAIKILPEEFSRDTDRVSRFQREAEVLASLNHPNIAAIYDLEEANGSRYLVLELVEGETLADRLQHGAMPLEESLKLAVQISEALEAAHEKGIIHRDLKPANIKVTTDGKVKVLDFGLAKAFGNDGGNTNVSDSPTLTMAATQQGIILGTAAYMSPEQARGKGLNRRTDVWALGAIIYEMLTGKQAFQGEDVGDLLATVVKTDPDWSSLPKDTPASIRGLLRRCLRKDRRQRLGDAGAVRIELEEALASPAPESASKDETRWSVPLFAAVLAGIVAIGIGFAIGARMRNPATQQERTNVTRLTLSLPSGTELTERPASLAISPDGMQVAFIGLHGGIEQLFIRRMDEFDSRPLKDTNGASFPFFSPDGKWLAFLADGKLKKLSTTGGVVETLADANGVGGSWGPDDTIVFLRNADLVAIPSTGGTPMRLATLNQAQTQNRSQNPEFLPGGDAVLFTTLTGAISTVDERSIDVLRVKTGERKTLIQGGYNPHYLATGHLIFLRSQTLMAVPFDLNRLEIVGTPVPLIEGLRQGYAGASFSCSRAGTCVYSGGGAVTQNTVVFVDRDGVSQTLPLMPQNYSTPRFSPSGDKIAFWMEQQRCDIVVYDIARNALTRLTTEGDNHYPIWTPDGRQLTFLSGLRPGSPGYNFMSKPFDGSSREQLLTETGQNLTPLSTPSWSPDGSVLAFSKRGDIWLLPMSGKQEPHPFIETASNESMPAFSPDGHWLAYTSDESGEQQIYVQPFPGPGARYPISTNGGTEPVWARNGRELFFRNRDQMMAVQISTQPALSASRPRVLFVSPFASRALRTNYDVSPDGTRFAMVNDGQRANSTTQINLVLNWFTELQQRVPVK
jgi:serine/threonine protein kinase